MINGDSLGYYEVLEVSQDAGAETIKQQYYYLAKKWHPDRNEGEEAEVRFQKISVAYNLLKDETNRLVYDILSQAYDSRHFPDMNNLKIYSNRKGNHDIDLRHIKLIKVTGKIVSHTETEVKEICDYKEAKDFVFKISLQNWLLGWWSLSGMLANIRAISTNYKKALYDFEGNFTLLAHNMLAYAQSQKFDEAYASARLALRYANPRQKQLIEQYMRTIPHQRDYIYPQWKNTVFKTLQMIVPIGLGLGFLIAGSTKVMTMEEFNHLWASKTNINYFQEVRFSGGGQTVDDMVVSKVVSIPVDTEELSNLYHLSRNCKIMYGPDDNFDVLTELPAGTTVRITGYTPDEQWARIMIDNGEMGFIRYRDIAKGIDKDIPENSQIYTGLR